MGFTLNFTDAAGIDQELVGGKSANLGRLTQAGFRVPPGFTVTTDAYYRAIADASLAAPIGELLQDLDFQDVDALEAVTAKIRDLIASAPVPEDIQASALNAYHELGEAAYVAVRSSGTAEDLAETSFAGQHDTYLDIVGDDRLLDAMRRCWASMWSARATAYRHQHGIAHETIGLAVIVQVMISSDVSGVMFTGNPLTAATDELVINASYGLGEGIVSGILEPDQFVLAHKGARLKHSELGSKAVRVVRDADAGYGVLTEQVPDPDRERLCLSADDLRKLGRLGKDVQKYYEGIPQDLEWAIADGELYLLQSRDITGVEFSWDNELEGPEAAEIPDDTLWTRAFSDAVMPGAITPLFYSIRNEGAQKCHRNEYELLGAPDIAVLPWWHYYRGRVYNNAAVDRGYFLTFLPPQLRLSELMEMVPDSQQQEVIDDNSWSPWPTIRALIRVQMLKPHHSPVGWNKSLMRRMSRHDEALGLHPEQIAELDDNELKDYLQSRIEAAHVWWEDVWTPLIIWTPYVMATLLKMIQHWYRGTNPAIFADLITGLPERTATLDENVKLWSLAEEIRRSEKLRGHFDKHEGAAFFTSLEESEEGRAFLTRYQTFVAEYGHRGHSERDMIFDRRCENPAIDYVNFRALLTAESASPDAAFDTLIAKREAAQADMEASISKLPLSRLKIEAFRLVHDWVLKAWMSRDNERTHSDRYTLAKKRPAMEIVRRLQVRGILHEDEHWFLSKCELYRLLDGAPRTRLIDQKIAARRRNWQKVVDGYTPPKFMQHNQFLDLDVAAGAEHVDGVFSGKPMSPGEVTGTVRILPRQSDIARIQKGDILVCDSTDPGWTPVFYAISGAIVQTGGMLSHAACISREYGLPAVQLPGAMSLLTDGATVTINGDTGKVTVVSEPDGESGAA